MVYCIKRKNRKKEKGEEYNFLKVDGNNIMFQVIEVTDFAELTNEESWLSSTRLVVKPDMLFGKRGKSGLVALNLDLAQVAEFVKARLGVQVMGATHLLHCPDYYLYDFNLLMWALDLL